MSQYHYVVQAQKPTAVTHSVRGNFTGPNDLNLILAKATRLEIHLVGEEGLELLHDIPVYGRIAYLRLFRPARVKKDRLLVCTEPCSFFVLSFNPKTGQLETTSAGDFRHEPGRETETGLNAVIDPTNSIIALHLYDGLLQVIGVDKKGTMQRTGADLKVEELQILDFCFVHTPAGELPRLLVLHQEADEARYVKMYTLSMAEKVLEAGPWESVRVESGASWLLPVPAPYGGALIVGEERVVYFNVRVVAMCALDPTEITAWGTIDASRYLLSDTYGQLYVVVLKHDGKKVLGVRLERLGVTSCAQSITYLDNGVVFVASCYGDSQLVRLHAKALEDGGFVEILEDFANLGSIVDMCVVDLDRQGQGKLITCSGVLQGGSLRVVTNGVGLQEEAAIANAGIKGTWALKGAMGSAVHKYLVVSFVGDTRVLVLREELLEELEEHGLQTGTQTLFCSDMGRGLAVQVTKTEVRLLACNSLKEVHKWSPASGAEITMADAYDDKVMVALAGGNVVMLTVGATSLVAKSLQMPSDAACVSLSRDKACEFAVVGLWSHVLIVVHIPSLKVVLTEPLEPDSLPRSIVISLLGLGKEAIWTLLCGMGDGSLITFRFNPGTGELAARKTVSVGSQPLLLTPLEQQGNNCVFAACDSPSVITTNRRKVELSNVNVPDVVCMTPFNCESFPDCIAIATHDQLIIGALEPIQRLHVDTIPLGMQPRRLAYQASSKSLLVVALAGEGYPGFEEEAENEQEAKEQEQQTIHVERKKAELQGGKEEEGEGGLDDEECDKIMEKESCGKAEDEDDGLDEDDEDDEDDDGAWGEEKRRKESTGESDEAESATGPAAEVGWVMLLDSDTMQIRHRVQLGKEEIPSSCASVQLGDDWVFVVGTGIVRPEEEEPKAGRLLVYKVNQARLELLHSEETEGAVYKVKGFMSGKLCAAINGNIQVYDWEEQEQQLVPECSAHGAILVLDLDVAGPLIMIGDLMQSMRLYCYDGETHAIEEISRDYDANWMTAVTCLSDNVYLGAENNCNLFALTRRTEGSDEERAMLSSCGRMHVGAFINVLTKGSLVMLPSEQDRKGRIIPTHLYGAIDGSIGVIAPLTKAQFLLLARLEVALEGIVKGVGGYKHAAWRAFRSDRNKIPKENFIDGELIECLLDLKEKDLVKVGAAVAMPIEDLVSYVQELARIH